MPFECQICFESYTDHGTEHAPYSPPCGHIMGKSCLERLKEFGYRGEFNCPFCKKRIIFELCHPIYLSLNEIVTSTYNGKNQAKNNMVKNRHKGDSTGDFTLRDSETNVGDY